MDTRAARSPEAPSASFGTWVQRRRTGLDLTQAELAGRVACAVITVRKIEADERRPSKLMAERLADALEIDEQDRGRFVAVARSFVSPVRLPSPAVGAGRTGPAPAPPSTPAPLHRLVGRADDLAELTSLVEVAGGPARLVTVTGPPGVGKTRLAIEVAGLVGRDYDLPVVFVELAAAVDADGLRERLSAAVDVSGGFGTDRFDLTRDALGRVPTLLVLDNAEHLVADVAGVAHDLLESCPSLCCLVTSRIRLDVYGEHEFPVEPLVVPPPGTDVPPGDLRRWAAVELFIERARAARRDLSLDDEDVEAVLQICRRLDGLPLAIELAARRVRELDLGALADGLDAGLGVLGTGSRDRDPRQHTMTDAVEWSYALLGATGQRVLRAAAVPAAGFTVTSIAAIADIDVDIASAAVGEITDHGLAHRAGPRWSLFEVVRAVAASRLDDHGEAADARRRHAAFHVERLDDHAPSCIGAETRAQLGAIDADYPELRAALAWAFEQPDAALGRRMVEQLFGYWYPRCLWDEGRHWAELAYASSDAPTDRAGAALALGTLLLASEPARAAELLDESERCAVAVGDDDTLAHLVGFQGLRAMMAGDLDAARDLVGHSGELFDRVANPGGQALSSMRLGRVAFLAGDLDDAERHWADALGRYTALGTDFGAANVLSDLSELALARGDLEGAMGHALEAVRLLWAFGVDWYTASIFTLVGNVLVEAGRLEEAARVYGMADCWLDDLGANVIPIVAATYAEHRATAEQALGREAFAAACADGVLLPRSLDSLGALAESGGR